MWTPWGESQDSTRLADGITSHSTAGHGGVKVRDDLNEQIPKYMRNENGWYEEDCEWAIPALVFPNAFQNQFNRAKEVFRSYRPDEYEKYFKVVLQPGESHKKDERQFHKDHANDYLVESASGDWKNGVPKGMVYCFAVRGGRTEGGMYASTDSKYFLVPEKEYATRGNMSFVIDESKHQQIQEIK
jgi:hypothetical protein